MACVPRLKVLADEELERIHDASVYLLENTGVLFECEEALTVLKKTLLRWKAARLSSQENWLRPLWKMHRPLLTGQHAMMPNRSCAVKVSHRPPTSVRSFARILNGDGVPAQSRILLIFRSSVRPALSSVSPGLHQ